MIEQQEPKLRTICEIEANLTQFRHDDDAGYEGGNGDKGGNGDEGDGSGGQELPLPLFGGGG